MAEKLIVIVGITGNQGGSVAEVFLKEPGWKIRGLTRDPTKASSVALKEQGVDVVAADLNDVASVKRAFTGANVIFANTDFWSSMAIPENHERAAKEGRRINELSGEIEVQQGKNIIDAAASVLAEEGKLEKFILSTLSDAKGLSKGKITYNLHFDAKWAQVEYLRSTQKELEKRTSLLQVGLFMTNWVSAPTMAPRKQPDGTYVLQIPMSPDRALPMVLPQKDTGHFVKGLVQVPPGKHLLGVGTWASWNDWINIWSRLYNVTCRFERAPRDELVQAIPGGIGEEMADMFDYYDQFGYTGGDPDVVDPKDLGVEIPTTSLEEYLKTADFSSVLAG